MSGMRSFMHCYRLGDDGRLGRVESSLLADPDHVQKTLQDAGYQMQVSSEVHNGTGAAIVVWSSDDEAQPAFFIRVMGANYELGYLVADDLPHLLATLDHMRALIALVGLDQRSDIFADTVASQQG